MIELTQEFTFDAAHRLDAGAPANQRIHGHSFYAEVTLRGEPDITTGMLCEFGAVKQVLGAIAEDLDHRMLNDIPDLGTPTQAAHGDDEELKVNYQAGGLTYWRLLAHPLKLQLGYLQAFFCKHQSSGEDGFLGGWGFSL